METFTAAGKTWQISLNFHKAKVIKAHLDIDIVDVSQSLRLFEKPLQRLEMIWLALDDKQGLTQEQFDTDLEDGFADANAALTRELINFIRQVSPLESERIQAEIELMEHRHKYQTEMIIELAQSPEMAEAIQTKMDNLKASKKNLLGKLSTESRAGLESTSTT